MSSQWLWPYAQTNKQLGHTKFQYGGGNPHEVPPPAEELLAADSPKSVVHTPVDGPTSMHILESTTGFGDLKSMQSCEEDQVEESGRS